MLRDLGSRSPEFIATVAEIRARLLELGGLSTRHWTAIPMQGSGTFGLESTIGSAVPRDGKLLVAVNGAYGHRHVQIAERLGIDVVAVEGPETRAFAPELLVDALHHEGPFTHAMLTHCETTTGVLNDIERLARIAREGGCSVMIDAMSSFGGIPFDAEALPADYVVSSSNKCIEGVPGFSFVLARKAALARCENQARSLSLDLHAQWSGLEKNGQFRFTPPVQVFLAFGEALRELALEGGIAARFERYAAMHRELVAGMRALGFDTVIADAEQSPIITSFHEPAGFDFDSFYSALREEGCEIYPGKLSEFPCFRIGSIGRLFPRDVRALLAAVQRYLSKNE
jgi:2-aminoethylphosphonate-pyruvate transaminase